MSDGSRGSNTGPYGIPLGSCAYRCHAGPTGRRHWNDSGDGSDSMPVLHHAMSAYSQRSRRSGMSCRGAGPNRRAARRSGSTQATHSSRDLFRAGQAVGLRTARPSPSGPCLGRHSAWKDGLLGKTLQGVSDYTGFPAIRCRINPGNPPRILTRQSETQQMLRQFCVVLIPVQPASPRPGSSWPAPLACNAGAPKRARTGMINC